MLHDCIHGSLQVKITGDALIELLLRFLLLFTLFVMALGQKRLMCLFNAQQEQLHDRHFLLECYETHFLSQLDHQVFEIALADELLLIAFVLLF